MLKPFGSSRLVTFGSYSGAIEDYYKRGGLNRGLSTGWGALDEHFRLQKGQLNIIIGIPSSGKSEIMDQVMLQTIRIHKWHWTVFSPENWPLPHHFQKLAEKWTGKPMFGQWPVPCMAPDDVTAAKNVFDNSIACLEPTERDSNLEGILQLLEESWNEFRTDAFLLDPWNEIEHHRPAGMTETEYIGQSLTKIRNFGRKHNIMMNIVAHPTKLQKIQNSDVYPVPTPYDCAGSANWRNKADGFLSIWRNYALDNGVVEVHIQKVRNKNIGRLGMVPLYWQRANGLFFDDATAAKDYQNHGICKRIS
jgi:twinkle protein